MRAREVGGRLRVRSGLNPMLWLCGIITMPSLIVYGMKENPSGWLLVFAMAPEATAILGFLFFMLFDRPYLQSESFQIRKMELEMIEEKGSPPIPLPNSIDAEVISNPEDPALLTEGTRSEQ
jgi:hypothetical protein